MMTVIGTPLLLASLTVAGAQQEIHVVTTLTTYAAIAREITGDRATVTSIARGNEDAHFIQPKPSYITIIRDADLFVTTGMDLELWVPALLDRAGNRSVVPGSPGYVSASQGVALLEVPTSFDRSQGDLHVFGNPHIVTDPLNAMIIGRNIVAGLKRVAPNDATFFEERLLDFERRILERLIGEELVTILTPETAKQLLSTNRLYGFLVETQYQGKALADRLDGWFGTGRVLRDKKMVCYHREWSYFSRRFGIPCVDYVEPRLGIPPTPRHVRDLIDLMRRQQIPAIFAANYYSKSQINQVAERTGATAVIVPENTEGTDSYFQLVDTWIDNLSAIYR